MEKHAWLEPHLHCASEMLEKPGSLQKMLHLANARHALAGGDLHEALTEVDAALALDHECAAGQILRRDILARTQRTSSSTLRRTGAPRWRRRVALGSTMLVAVAAISFLTLRKPCRGCTSAPSRPVSAASAVPIRTASVQTESIVVPDATVAAPGPSPDAAGINWTSQRLARLHVRPNWRGSALHVDDARLIRDLGEGIAELWIGSLTPQADVIFVGGTIDDDEWAQLRAAIRPSGVVWRVSSTQTATPYDADAAGAAGFVRRRTLRYAEGFVAEQFTPTKSPARP